MGKPSTVGGTPFDDRELENFVGIGGRVSSPATMTSASAETELRHFVVKGRSL